MLKQGYMSSMNKQITTEKKKKRIINIWNVCNILSK